MSIIDRISNYRTTKITRSYQEHLDGKAKGESWAVGIDIVLYENNIASTFVARCPVKGKVVKLVNYMTPFPNIDRDGMGYGNYFLVECEDGFDYLFAHFKTLYANVQTGAILNVGDVVGEVGNTGNVWGKTQENASKGTGAHLHFEKRKRRVNYSINAPHNENTFEWVNPLRDTASNYIVYSGSYIEKARAVRSCEDFERYGYNTSLQKSPTGGYRVVVFEGSLVDCTEEKRKFEANTSLKAVVDFSSNMSENPFGDYGKYKLYSGSYAMERYAQARVDELAKLGLTGCFYSKMSSSMGNYRVIIETSDNEGYIIKRIKELKEKGITAIKTVDAII